VRRVVDELHAAHSSRELRIELPERALRGDWDFDRLAQVLCNLVENALKYSPAHSAVHVRLLRGAGNTALLEVHNTGEPIPEALLPQLFEPFRLGDQTDATVKQSLGLGLYIAKEIVRAHAGSVSVRSDVNEGTTFRVCLPCAPEETARLVEAQGLPLSA